MYTILPLVLIFFFVYAQLPQQEENTSRDRKLHFDVLLAYLGTASVVALFYFQFPIEWVVTSWAAVVFTLLGIALLLNRPVFLHQGLLLTVGVFGRGMAHNLFGESNFSGGDWKGDYVVLVPAVAVLLASLFFAFRLRGSFSQRHMPDVNPRFRGSPVIPAAPNKLCFSFPSFWLHACSHLKMKPGMVTVSWGVEGVLVFLAAPRGQRTQLPTDRSRAYSCSASRKVMAHGRLGPSGRRHGTSP